MRGGGRFRVLMVGDQPAGGQWNFDRDNRKPPKGKLNLPEALWFEPEPTTQEVMDWVKQSPAFQDSQAYWQVEPFRWAVTRSQALQVLQFFVEMRLSRLRPLPRRNGDWGANHVARHAVALPQPGAVFIPWKCCKRPNKPTASTLSGS